jgi:hypothetical protein
MPAHGYQVLRGAGPKSTELISTGTTGCAGLNSGICAVSTKWTYAGASNVQPSSGSNQCAWSGGYSQGTTTITLSSCGGTPTSGHIIYLDQAINTSDNGGVYICDSVTPVSCNYDGSGSTIGRTISSLPHTQVQATYVTGVTNNGDGTYSATISPGVYFTNVASGYTPGVWWSDKTVNNGIENMTIDGTSDPNSTVGLFDCYQCWVKNVTFLNGGRSSVLLYQSSFSVIRDSYFYQAQGHATVSYTIEFDYASGNLIENNIMQQVTNPVMINNGTGNVIDYNFGVDEIAGTNYVSPAYASHNGGNEFNLWEGNNFGGLSADDAWGSSAQQTYFRNILAGWQNGRTQGSTPIVHRSYNRVFNIVGNVLGQPGYHKQYQTYATSNTGGVGGSAESTSIYSLGWAFSGSCGTGTAQTSPYCDAAAFSTLMRWGNWDVVNGATQWNSTEASPATVSYVNANFTSSYFSSLAHTLPASLYYSSTPSWWTASKAWPAVGPDVSSGNLGVCTGTYAGAQATASSQCSGGSLSSAWAAHANSIPAQDCYLSVMNGPPDGTGSALSFDASQCYASYGSSGSSGTKPLSPTGLAATVTMN